MIFILLAVRTRNTPLWISLPLSPISATLGNFSAWQQPFWERISKGHHTNLLNFELECTHTKTHTYMHISKSKYENTLWLMPMPLRISYQTYTVCMSIQNTGEAEVSLPETQPPTSQDLYFDVPSPPHTLTYFNTDTLSPYQTRTISQSHTHSSSISLNILQYSKAEIWYNVVQLSVKCCNGAFVCMVHSITAIVPLTNTHKRPQSLIC